MRTLPSRDFLVRQAVLNAVEYWKPFYSLGWLRSWDKTRPLPGIFSAQIKCEFSKLVRRYDGGLYYNGMDAP